MNKPIRARLQDNALIYRSRVHIEIGVTTGYAAYGARLCGTYPVRATLGVSSKRLDVGTSGAGVAYSTRLCGTAPGGLI